ncbi:hypothetical protein A2U01_0094432 [Trifolium medium]|uniref:Uncharacterized protein n=1 Tax=Trifolium medium TaxID=97028 RepID=A0A392UJV5_9FABA|nr:hypothetical protein [Trifolium medium]
MDKANPLSTPMMGRTLNVEKGPFRPKEDNEEDLGSEVHTSVPLGRSCTLSTVQDLI